MKLVALLNRICVITTIGLSVYWGWYDEMRFFRYAIYAMLCAGVFGVFELAFPYLTSWIRWVGVFLIALAFVIFGLFLIHSLE
ncbi:MAG: hypothetical protein GXO56_06390 [Chloroflexi bacterium]|nr:hypothetical protein [Chloroflexota bacterium]